MLCCFSACFAIDPRDVSGAQAESSIKWTWTPSVPIYRSRCVLRWLSLMLCFYCDQSVRPYIYYKTRLFILFHSMHFYLNLHLGWKFKNIFLIPWSTRLTTFLLILIHCSNVRYLHGYFTGRNNRANQSLTLMIKCFCPIWTIHFYSCGSFICNSSGRAHIPGWFLCLWHQATVKLSHVSDKCIQNYLLRFISSWLPRHFIIQFNYCHSMRINLILLLNPSQISPHTCTWTLGCYINNNATIGSRHSTLLICWDV